MKKLVLGGLGFLGSHICDYLSGEISIYDLRLPEHSKYKCYVNNLDMLIQQSDIVYNFAGMLRIDSHPDYIQNIIKANISFATLVMQKCLEYETTLVSVGMPSKESEWINPYAITKTCMRQFAEMFYGRGLRGCTLIPYNVYGEGQRYNNSQKLIPSVIHHVLCNIPVPVYGDGNQVTDQIYVHDFAKYVAGITEFDGQEVHIGSGSPVKVIDVVKMICEIMDVNLDVNWLPMRDGEGLKHPISPNAVECIDLRVGLQATIAAWCSS